MHDGLLSFNGNAGVIIDKIKPSQLFPNKSRFVTTCITPLVCTVIISLQNMK